MLLIDGVRYKEWTPEGENAEEELEQMVKEHAQDIFGENSIYLDKKQKLKSLAGIGSIPDGLVIMFGNVPEWHIVEVELSSHDPYGHIVPQVDRFLNGIDNRDTRNKIIEALYDAIYGDEFLKVETRQAIGLDKDVHKFLSDLIARPPTIAIVIEEYTSQLREALKKYTQKKVVEFRTFVSEGVGLPVHAHLFEPVYTYVPAAIVVTPLTTPSPKPTMPPIIGAGDELEIVIRNPSFINFHIFQIPKGRRQFLPGYKVPFTLETDIGEVQTYVVSAKAGTQVGDPNAGYFFQAGLAEWYRQHPTIRVGDKVKITAVEPMKKYRLEIVK